MAVLYPVNAELCFQMLFALHSSCWAGWQQQAQLGQGRQSSAVSLFMGQDEGRAGTAGSGKGAVAARATEDVPPTSAAVSQLILARDAPWALLQQENLPPPPAVPAAQRGYYSPVTQT